MTDMCLIATPNVFPAVSARDGQTEAPVPAHPAIPAPPPAFRRHPAAAPLADSACARNLSWWIRSAQTAALNLHSCAAISVNNRSASRKIAMRFGHFRLDVKFCAVWLPSGQMLDSS